MIRIILLPGQAQTMLLTNKMLQYYDHMVVIVLESRKFNCEDFTYFFTWTYFCL
jgi:hypothetical protein